MATERRDNELSFKAQLEKFIENISSLLVSLNKHDNSSELTAIFNEAAQKLKSLGNDEFFKGNDDRKILLSREITFFNAHYNKDDTPNVNKLLDMAKVILGSLGTNWMVDIMIESVDLTKILYSNKPKDKG